MRYSKLLERFRLEIPVKTYEIRCNFEGDFPENLKGVLPIFGSEEGNQYILNSGGRGGIIYYNKWFRLKGIDPKGVITQKVAQSKKNKIRSIELAVSSVPDKDLPEEVISKGGEYKFNLGKKPKPFNFFTYDCAMKEKLALEELAKKYEDYGFTHPCQYAGLITYDNLRWNGSPLSTLVFDIPNPESDLREQEVIAQIGIELSNSYDKLEKYGERVIDLYKKLLQFHAFDTRLLNECNIEPTLESDCMQNYVLGSVSDGEIGVSRIDHTSSIKTRKNRRGLQIPYVVYDLERLAAQISFATEYAESPDNTAVPNPDLLVYGTVLYTPKISCKKLGPLELREIYPKTSKLMEEMDEIFHNAGKSMTPEPIKEKELLNICKDLGIV